MKVKNRFFNLLFATGIFFTGLISFFLFFGQQAASAADSCTPPATTYGTDTLSVNIPSTTTYSVWVRMEIPSSSSNSVLLNIDNANCYNVEPESSLATNAWQWVNYSDGNSADVMSIPLTQGSHTFLFTGTSSGVNIDKIEVLSDNTCTPTGTGDLCAPSSTDTPPTVSITSPVSGDTLSGTSTLSSNAQDASGITSVQFMLDGVALGAPVTSSPYNYSWDTTTATNGSHTITAVATDLNGFTTTSAPVTIMVNNSSSSPPPTTSITSTTSTAGTPTSVANAVYETVNVDANASVTSGTITKVELYANSTLIATDTSAPYNFSWNTLPVFDGTYALTTVAYSSTGLTTTSSPLTVYVDNGDIHGTGVNAAAFGTLGFNYGKTSGQTYATGDIDGNGAINSSDFSIFSKNYGYKAP